MVGKGGVGNGTSIVVPIIKKRDIATPHCNNRIRVSLNTEDGGVQVTWTFM